MFSFPPLDPKHPSTSGNWYQDLIDHPDCQGDPVKIQEAYESYRQSKLSQAVASFTSQPPSAKIIADKALISQLDWQKRNHSTGTDPDLAHQEVNCLVFWARLSDTLRSIVGGIQQQIYELVGKDVYLIPQSDMHLSVLELSHRHPLSELQATFNLLGSDALRAMLNLPTVIFCRRNSGTPHIGQTIRLVKPQLTFDAVGVALTLVPDTESGPSEGDSRPNGEVGAGRRGADKHASTYQHLRSEMHKLALKTDIKIDTCYTAPTAHVTIARFIGDEFFTSQSADLPTDQGFAVTNGPNSDSPIEKFVTLIQNINRALVQTTWKDLKWVISEDQGLECQFGYVKFGRSPECAIAIGACLGDTTF